MTSNYTEQLKNAIRGWGGDLVGVADVALLKKLNTDPPDLLDAFTRTVSIAVQLPAGVFEMISDHPIPIYRSVFETANRILDQLAFKTAMMLQNDGFDSLPIPASQILDRENWHGAISHKAVARMAGLGWQGKSLLLVTPNYGPRIRLVTVLTTASLEVDSPMENRCGDCTLCRDACPAGAIKGVNTQDHYSDRDEALFFSKCVEKLTKEFTQIPHVRGAICGVCIKACPFGRKAQER